MARERRSSSSKSDVWAAARSRGVELGSGLLMVAIGVALSAHEVGAKRPDGLLVALGAVSAAFGGVLVSWLASAEHAKRQARDELDDQLEAVSRALGQASGQIGQAVQQAQIGTYEAETALALISQSTGMIYGQIDQLQLMLGRQFEGSSIVETVSELETLAGQLTRPPGEPADVSRQKMAEVGEQIATLTSELSLRVVGQANPGPTSGVAVDCPYCNYRNDIMLADKPGSTAAETCESCSQRFNVHRGKDGGAISRPMPEAMRTFHQPDVSAQETARSHSTTTDVILECSQCHDSIAVRHPRNGLTKRFVYCTGCLALYEVDFVNVTAAYFGMLLECHAEIVGISKDDRPVLKCPGCGEYRNGILQRADNYGALCTKCMLLPFTSKDLFERWQQSKQALVSHELQTPLEGEAEISLSEHEADERRVESFDLPEA